jgi:uncharacterized RDD family membrane protein YckC
MSTVGGTDTGAARSVASDSTDVVGRRIGALIVDGLMFGVVFVVMALATGGGHSGHGRASLHLSGTPFLIYLLAWFLYFTICEATSGQTLGKRLLRVKVVSDDGSAVSWGQAAARNLLRFVDALPIFYVVGLISIAATGRGRRQRVGDIAARTRVVAA